MPCQQVPQESWRWLYEYQTKWTLRYVQFQTWEECNLVRKKEIPGIPQYTEIQVYTLIEFDTLLIFKDSLVPEMKLSLWIRAESESFHSESWVLNRWIGSLTCANSVTMFQFLPCGRNNRASTIVCRHPGCQPLHRWMRVGHLPVLQLVLDWQELAWINKSSIETSAGLVFSFHFAQLFFLFL